MKDKTTEDLMQEIVYELKTMTTICVFTLGVTILTTMFVCCFFLLKL
jgi:hypothetical protein